MNNKESNMFNILKFFKKSKTNNNTSFFVMNYGKDINVELSKRNLKLKNVVSMEFDKGIKVVYRF